MARQIGARGYIEHSVKTQLGVDALRDALTYYAFEDWRPPKGRKGGFLRRCIPMVN